MLVMNQIKQNSVMKSAGGGEKRRMSKDTEIKRRSIPSFLNSTLNSLGPKSSLNLQSNTGSKSRNGPFPGQFKTQQNQFHTEDSGFHTNHSLNESSFTHQRSLYKDPSNFFTQTLHNRLRNSKQDYLMSNGQPNTCKFFKTIYHANDHLYSNVVHFNNTYRADHESYLLSSIDQALRDQENLELQVKRALSFDRIRRQRELLRDTQSLEELGVKEERKGQDSSRNMVKIKDIQSLLRKYEFSRDPANGRFSPHFEGSEEILKKIEENNKAAFSEFKIMQISMDKEQINPLEDNVEEEDNIQDNPKNESPLLSEDEVIQEYDDEEPEAQL
ncbi:hypothetical protein FGO68_gene3880 [Halteria grandinella]|uniref:Uncharacterized protein n=1 Tax=Halteria grandinella TaxID=5974 RepID=A0A8J8NCN2_HALGN|nr:hypothetical protein FGO68_gene3880 [Halteria grandinella]